MDAINQTLFIPLYGKAYVSRRGMILSDPKAEEIWTKEGFPLRGKSASKWLAYYMAMRSKVFDRWTRRMMEEDPAAVVLHLGCGLDSRVLRLGALENPWFDLDFPEVIQLRRNYFPETPQYRMLGADLRRQDWLESIPGSHVIVVMEGVSMYLTPEGLSQLLTALRTRFQRVTLLMDCYTEFAAKATKYKNPINDVGVTQVYGLDDPQILEKTGLRFTCPHDMTPEDLIGQLPKLEQGIFRFLYAGKMAQKLYRLYEYRHG